MFTASAQGCEVHEPHAGARYDPQKIKTRTAMIRLRTLLASIFLSAGITFAIAQQVGINTRQSGIPVVPVSGCDTHAFYDASDNGLKTLVAGTTGKRVYVCAYIMATGSSATNLSLTSGTGVDCGTSSTAITPAYQLAANDRVGAATPFWAGLVTLAPGTSLCINASAGNAHQAEVWYTVQ
jgi:hypothetical protein